LKATNERREGKEKTRGSRTKHGSRRFNSDWKKGCKKPLSVVALDFG